ncbi:MAG TPA: PEP-CTERM sorting domain-containing protein [Terriglobales bacterium]|nr:PEP-CTERM sorting domain-containing protein [Terriglobales bacterium]
MGKCNLVIGATLAGGLVLAAAPAAHADPITPYVITMTEQHGNVLAIGDGMIDLTGLLPGLVDSTPTNQAGVDPSGAQLEIGLSTNPFITYGATLSGPENFGTGATSLDSSSSGGAVASDINGGSVILPEGYQSLTFISNSDLFDHATLASLGVTPGVYTWTWGSGAEQSITLDAEATPEPASLLLLVSGLLAGLCLCRKRLFAGA